MAKMNKKNKEIKKKESTEESNTESSVMEYSNDQIKQAEHELESLEVSSGSEKETNEQSNEEHVSSEENDTEESNSSTKSGSAVEEEDNETLRTIFIKDLDYDVREEDIKKQMVRLGHVIRVTVPMSHDDRRNKGFAYVEFKTSEEAKKALQLNGSEFLGRKVMVSQAKPKTNRNIYTVFCKNLNYNTTKEDLMNHFEKFGKVYNISIPVDPENKERNKGFCFVEYTERETVEAVLKAKHKVNERLLYLNEGNKNDERNEKRSKDRLYGRKEESDRRDRFPRERSQGGRFSKFDNKREGRFNKRGNDGDENESRGNRFDKDRRGNNRNENRREKSFERNNKPKANKKVFDDSD